MSNRIVYRRPIDGLLAVASTSDSARGLQFPLYEALVVDVILDHTHPDYSNDGFNVGCIKIRIFDEYHAASNETLPWADPIDVTLYELPLIGELVSVQKIRGNFFYSRKIPLSRRVQENGMLKLNDALNLRGKNSITNSVQGLVSPTTTTADDELSIDRHKFGEYYRPDSRVRQLKHFEGDVIVQGRMGNTIRFGSSQMDPSSKSLAPNIILRTGQGKDLEKNESTTDTVFGLVLEDVNKDASSIWMTSDQTIPFEPITIDAGSFYRSSATAPQKFDKASIILASDKILLNAKKTNVMIFSNQEIYLNSYKRTAIDTDDSIYLTANVDIVANASSNFESTVDNDFIVRAGSDIVGISLEKITLASPKIYIGSIDNTDEPIVGGSSLSKFLARFIWTLLGNSPAPTQMAVPNNVVTAGLANNAHVIGATGPAALNPIITNGLIKLYRELLQKNAGSNNSKNFSGAPFNSESSFVMLKNEDVSKAIEKNDFESGEQTTTENNEWLVSDPYYKIL